MFFKLLFCNIVNVHLISELYTTINISSIFTIICLIKYCEEKSLSFSIDSRKKFVWNTF